MSLDKNHIINSIFWRNSGAVDLLQWVIRFKKKKTEN